MSGLSQAAVIEVEILTYRVQPIAVIHIATAPNYNNSKRTFRIIHLYG